MKACEVCGTINFDTSEICEKCKAPLRRKAYEAPIKPDLYLNKKDPELDHYSNNATKTSNTHSTLSSVIKVFMILATIFDAILLIPLFWCVPMTINYFTKINNGQRVSAGFKLCTLLFVGFIPGLLMLFEI